MFQEKKICVLMNRSFECTLAPLTLPKSAYLGTVLDGELLDREFIVYDAVCVSGQSVAKNCLLDRYGEAEKFIKGILKVKTDPFVVRLKELFLFNEFQDFLQKYKTFKYVDGIILTPNDDPIRTGTHETLFKWKPRDLNTIDFQMKKDKNRWNMFVQDAGNLIFESEIPIEGSPTWITEDCIAECQYVNGKWKPIHLREDKKHPNNRRTFYRTLKNISEDIKIEEFSTLI